MSSKKHLVSLSEEERSKLDIVARSYRHSKRERDRAKVLLLADTNQEGIPPGDAQIAESVGIQPLTVSKIRARAVARGVLESLSHREQSNRKERRLDGAAEAQLVTIACSQASDGRKRWTMQLLKERLIQMEIVESIDEATRLRGYEATRLRGYEATRLRGYEATRLRGYEATRLRGYEATRLRGYEATRLRGYEATRLRGYEATRLRGYEATRLRGYEATRLRGYEATRLRGYEATRLRGYEATRLRGYEATICRTLKKMRSSPG